MQDWKKQAEHLKFDKGLSYTQISEILFPNMGKKDVYYGLVERTRQRELT